MPKQNYSKITSYKPVSSTGMKKLDWFFAFLGMIHVSMEEAANILNYRRNTIQYWKQTDDVNLSLIMKIVDALGFYLDIKIWRGDSWEEVSTITKREMSRLVPGKREPHCLAPLVAAMCLYDFTAFRLAKMMNLWVTTVRYWLDQDDIAISRLFEIVEAMDCHLMIRVIKKDDIDIDRQAEFDGPMFITSIDIPDSKTRVSDYLS